MKARRAGPAGGPGDHRPANLRRLVRQAKAAGVPVGELAARLRPACRALGLDAELVEAEARGLWPGCRAGERPSRLAEAVEAAATLDVPLPAGLTGGQTAEAVAKLGRLAAVAWLLQQEHGPGKWFPFPSAELGKGLGSHRKTVDGWVRQLEDHGVIRVLRDADTGRTVWDHQAGQARLVRFTGPGPALPY